MKLGTIKLLAPILLIAMMISGQLAHPESKKISNGLMRMALLIMVINHQCLTSTRDNLAF